MVRRVKLRRMGGSVGATLPKDLADRFHLDPGDDVFVVETPHGLLLTPYDAVVQDALAIAADAQKRNQNGLRALAR